MNNGLKVKETVGFNQQRYHISKTEEGKIMIMFKRDFFNSFGKIFAHLGESGVGETINLEDLKLAVQHEVKNIYFIYKNAHIYKISIEDFMINSHKRKVDFEDKEVRSVSIKYLKRIGEMYQDSN